MAPRADAVPSPQQRPLRVLSSRTLLPERRWPAPRRGRKAASRTHLRGAEGPSPSAPGAPDPGSMGGRLRMAVWGTESSQTALTCAARQMAGSKPPSAQTHGQLSPPARAEQLHPRRESLRAWPQRTAAPPRALLVKETLPRPPPHPPHLLLPGVGAIPPSRRWPTCAPCRPRLPPSTPPKGSSGPEVPPNSE